MLQLTFTRRFAPRTFRLPLAFVLVVAGAAADEGAAVRAAPAPSLNIQELVSAAVREHRAVLRIPPGTYRVPTERVEISGAEGLTIDGTGSTWLFSSLKGNAINVRLSKNVTLKGFTVDYDPLPFTQATVTAVKADGSACDFRVHDGYPRLAEPYDVNHVHVFDGKTRRWKTAAPDIYAREVKVLSPETGRLVLTPRQAGNSSLQVGDRLVFNVRDGGGISIRDSQSTRVEDVTILAAPGLAVAARFVDGQNYFRFKVARGPRPEGAREDRLFSSSADAFNYAYARTGPTLENCDFAWMGDDSVNLHGVTLPVLKVVSPTEFWTARPNNLEEFGSVIQNGDTLRLLAPDNFAIKDELILRAWEPGDAGLKLDTAAIKRLYPASPGERITYYKVTLQQPGRLSEGDWFDIPAIAAPHFVIRNSYFHDHRGRGLRLMASHGVVENNRLERIKQVAISLGPGYALWREAGWVEDVEVRGNSIRDVAADPEVSGPNSATPGAISVFSQMEPPGGSFPRGNRDIRILNNLIQGAAGAGIHINAAQDVTVRGNTVKRTNSAETRAANKYGLTAGYAISVNNSTTVRIEGNKTSDPGRFQQGSVQPLS